MMDIFAYLRNNTYPGRGIIVGRHASKRVVAYFIMGRSVNSRNRIFVKKNDILFTKAFDESRVADPSLIIYNAIREYNDEIIVTNGNQTDTIYDYVSEGRSFEEALKTREYEPDAPNYTPRISAILKEDCYQISILRKEGENCQREYSSYSYAENKGHFISTYEHDGDPLPSFEGAPREIDLDLPFSEFARKLWNSLNEDNKVSLYVRFNDKEIIYNRNEE